MLRFLLYLPYLLLAEPCTTLLFQAEKIAEIYSELTLKIPPPQTASLAESYLQQNGSNWLEINLCNLNPEMGQNLLSPLEDPTLWQLFKEIGIDAVHIKNLREKGQIRLNPNWQSTWEHVQEQAQKQRISFVGDLIGNAIAMGPDFFNAIQNQGEYNSLFHLIEIDPHDWELLPSVSSGCSANIPWLSVQKLHKSGYVPERYTPYVKESDWNATRKVVGVDGKTRRWIYLKEGKDSPVLAWLSPSLAAYRLSFADVLQMHYGLQMDMLTIDGKIPPLAQAAISLWIRKIGAFSALTTDGTIASMTRAPTDFVYDTATSDAYLHALIAQDTTSLRTIYRLFLEHGVASKTLIHFLPPFDLVCEALGQSPRKVGSSEEQITNHVLRKKLLKEDLLRLEKERVKPAPSGDSCAHSLEIQDAEMISKLHLLLTFGYAMQPGIFSLSLEDLLGAFTPGKLNLLSPNPDCLYCSLPIQMQNAKSFASILSKILSVRNRCNIESGELIGLPCPIHPGTLLLLHRLPNHCIQLLALNFSRSPVLEAIECKEIAKTTAIDLMTSLSEEKLFSSAQFSFTLSPFSARVFCFQPKGMLSK